MRTVYRYDVAVTDFQVLQIQGCIRVLSVGTGTHDNLSLWALVDTEDTRDTQVNLRILGTGNPIPDFNYLTQFYTFLNTVVMGKLVWHIFIEVGRDVTVY